MAAADDLDCKPKESSIEVLTQEAMKLLRTELDDLYVTLGILLLVRNLPSHTAGIVSDLFAFWSSSEPKSQFALPPSERLVAGYRNRTGEIYDQLGQDGRGYLAAVGDNLRKALSNQDILSLSDQVNVSILQIIVVIVSGTLRLPVELEPISVTVSAILVKLGLRNFCDSKPN